MYFPLLSHAILPALMLGPLVTPPDSTIERLIRERVDSHRNAGIVVGIIDAAGGRHVFHYGSAGDGALPLGRNTVFEIGSATKTFTVALLAQMVAHGDVALDDPVTKYLPANVTLSPKGRPITLLDLATQSSGLPRLPLNIRPANPDDPYVDYGATQLYAFLSGFTPPRAPGEQYEYSNLGVGLLGFVLGRRDGDGFEQAVEHRILQPLGMTDTHITRTADTQRRFATGHNRDGDVVPPWHFDALAGAGALSSTLDDMMTFLAANMDSASTPLGAVLSGTHASRRPTTIANTTIGLAWHILHAHDTDIVWHNGETAGFHSFIGFDQARHVGVVILTNSATSIDDLGFHLVDERNALNPPPAPPQEPPLAPSLLQRYAGAYDIAPGARLTVTVDGNRLYAQLTGQQRFRIFATTDSTFKWSVVEAQLTFQRDARGEVTGAVLHQGGRDTPMKRVP